MFGKNKKLIFFFLATTILALSVANFVLAQGLEVHYPSIPKEPTGTKLTITATTTAPGYIKYIFNFSLIIGAIIIFGSLVCAGFLYLSSTGNPALLQEAKSRMFSSVLGLIIVFGAYVLLNTLNPQLLVLRTQPVKLPYQGILLEDTSSDKQKVFFTSVDDFNGFKPYNYKFLSPEGKIEVTLFSEPGFSGTSTVLEYYNGNTLKSLAETYSAVDMEMAQSMKIRGIGPGVYLYDEDGNEFGPITEPISDLKFYDFTKATKIMIKNAPGTNFQAILYNQKGFHGEEARIFFQRQKIPEDLFGKGEGEGKTPPKCNPTSTCNRRSGCGGHNYLGEGVTTATTTCGNIASSTQKIKIQWQDRYGSMKNGKYPLSIDIHQMDINEDAHCTVTLYKKPDYEGTSSDEKCVIKNFLFEPIAIDNANICGDSWGSKKKDSVKSIKIEGNCFVFLFDNRKNDCYDNCSGIAGKCHYCCSSWGVGSGTGETHVIESSKPDLKPYPIGYHATSIAIYPGSPSH